MRRLSAIAFVFSALLIPASAQASLIRITPQGVSPANQTVTHPVPISTGGFRLTYHSNGNLDPLLDPLVLIFGVNGGTGSAPALSAGSSSGIAATITVGGANPYGGNWNTSTGFGGGFDASAGSTDVYSFLGLKNGSNSESYVNWNGATGVSSWNLFVYTIAFNPNMNTGDWVEFNTNLPGNSMVVGYGCSELAKKAGACGNGNATQSTPFTFAGRTTQVPEPTSLLLISGALAGMGILRRRQKKA